MSTGSTASDATPRRASGERWSRAASAMLGWAAIYALSAYLGRLTVLPETGFSLIWPAAGVGVLWLALSRRRDWTLVLVAVALLSGLINHVTGTTWSEGAVLGVANAVHAAAGATLLVRLPGMSASVSTALRSSVQFWELLVMGFLSSLLSATVAAAGFLLVDSPLWSFDDFLAWMGRNGAGTLGVVALGLLVLRAFEPGPTAGSRVGARAAVTVVRAGVRTLWNGRGRELIALSVVSVAVYWVAFVRYEELPLEFPLLTLTAWAGLRFDAVVTHVHSLLVATGTVALTLSGIGSFAAISSGHDRATVSQLFIALVIAFGLMLGLGNEERRALNRRLVGARADAADRADLLETVLTEMRDGMAIVDETGRILMRNPAGRRMVGIEDRAGEDEADPDAPVEILAADGRPLPTELLPHRRAFATGGVVVQDVVIRLPSGEARYVQMAVTPLRSVSAQNQRLAVMLYHDSHAEHEKWQALESFAGVVAHDLKAPLTAVRGWTELLQDTATDSDQVSADAVTEISGHIEAAARSMHQLIQDLLLFSTASDSKVEVEDVDTTTVAREALEVVMASEAGRGSGVVEDLPAVRAERSLMRQLFTNLLTNAFKYAGDGQHARVVVSAQSDGDGWVQIFVTDNGPGIPPEARAKVFEAFQRLPGTGQTGTGLGLAICRRIAERYGGSIMVGDNPDGPGSRFVVRLRVASCE